MGICNIALWLISAILVLTGTLVIILVLRSRGVNVPSSAGQSYNEGITDLIWTVTPAALLVLLITAVVLDNRC